MRVSRGATDIGNYREGREAAAEVDSWLVDGNTRLPRAGGIKTRVRPIPCVELWVGVLKKIPQTFFPPSTLVNGGNSGSVAVKA